MILLSPGVGSVEAKNMAGMRLFPLENLILSYLCEEDTMYSLICVIISSINGICLKHHAPDHF